MDESYKLPWICSLHQRTSTPLSILPPSTILVDRTRSKSPAHSLSYPSLPVFRMFHTDLVDLLFLLGNLLQSLLIHLVIGRALFHLLDRFGHCLSLCVEEFLL